jgi:hypothetical protein
MYHTFFSSFAGFPWLQRVKSISETLVPMAMLARKPLCGQIPLIKHADSVPKKIGRI